MSSQNLDNDTSIAMTSAIRATASALLHRLQQGLSHPPVELVYTPHQHWPLPHSTFPSGFDSTSSIPLSRPLRISVLDSSFNPPTLAHLALGNSRPPHSSTHHSEGQERKEDYDARLLLLSVRNADKSLKPGDATYTQRLEMMRLLVEDVRSSSPQSGSPSKADPRNSNVAIAIIDEPTFVGKSKHLLSFLKTRLASFSPPPPNTIPLPTPQLTFLVGLDTLERLFSPRYYSSETSMLISLRKFLSPEEKGGDNSYVVCARRVLAPSSTASTPSLSENAAIGNKYTEEKELRSILPSAGEFLDSGRVALINIGEKESTYSSSAVRGAIGRLGLSSETTEEDTHVSGEVWKSFVPRNIAEYITKERLYISEV
ncbi:hypothetical protein BDQ12DRAFT_691414 [Crucibulum laeve]|uniref:Nicotinamide-nucleotide adenylyltransferase n=1 Tax=Crucibulum laeve TaxID=68775 RepID=A0A5C3LLT2_9AGAR|nr:hypothetical protein BDQ12DRAFT_691414 [Crucibulum laeve]